MRKICLVLVGLYLHLLSAFSQTVDSAKYKNRTLKVDEINLVSSYYNQDGNHSAVTGGIGTQELSDYVTDLDLNLSKYNKFNHKVDLDIDAGIEYYTSASSDKIDPMGTLSSASSHDIHFYPSVTRTVTDERNGTKFDLTGSVGTESYYLSSGFGGGFAKKSKDKSREFEVKAKCYLDKMKLILPVELRTLQSGGLPGAYNQNDYPWVHRTSLSTSFTLSQIVNQRLQLLFLLDVAYQQGYLALPFYRIYFKDSTETIEKLPSERLKLPVGIRASYFLGDRFVLRSYYRFYCDDWGLVAHTIDNELAIKFTPFVSVAPFFRYYTQRAINWFAPYREHVETEKYYSSDYDFAAFHSDFFGAGFRWAPPNGFLGHPDWSLIELRYGHYTKTVDFASNVISLNLRFK